MDATGLGQDAAVEALFMIASKVATEGMGSEGLAEAVRSCLSLLGTWENVYARRSG